MDHANSSLCQKANSRNGGNVIMRARLTLPNQNRYTKQKKTEAALDFKSKTACIFTKNRKPNVKNKENSKPQQILKLKNPNFFGQKPLKKLSKKG